MAILIPSRNTQECEPRPSRNRPCIPSRNPVYTHRSRDHECPPLTTAFNLMNADGGIGTAPSSTAARSSLPTSKDYPCPRLRQTSPPHCTSTRSSNTPLGSTVRALCPTYMRRRMHKKSGTATSTSARTGNIAHAHTHSHKCTLARRTRGALTCETVGAATPWRREQSISATKASKRRPSTRCKRKAKLRLDLAALRRLVRVA